MKPLSIIAAIVPLSVFALNACRDGAQGPRDTRNYVKARLEFVGELMPLGAETTSAATRQGLSDVWAERLKRLRESGAAVIDSARFPAEGNAAAGFVFVVDVRVPPPCEAEATVTLGRSVWSVLANQGDFGVHAVDDGLRSQAATFLRGLDEVADVTTAASHRGLLVVKLTDEGAAPRALDRLGEYLANSGGFAVRIPATDVAGGDSDPRRIHLAIVRDPPSFDGTAVASAEAAPERDGFTQVTVAFKDAAVPALATLTEKELGRHVVVSHDRGEFLAAPVIGSVVRDGRWLLRLPAVIGPNRAESLAAVIGAGSLSVAPVLRVLRHGCVREQERVDWHTGPVD